MKKNKKNRPGKSRIPGVYVGEMVDTSVGEKKKVCFNIGGKWYFRMVDPGWRAPGRPHKARGQKSEAGRRKTEASNRKARR